MLCLFRVLSVVLCGSERLPLDVLEVTEDASWSLMTTVSTLLGCYWCSNAVGIKPVQMGTT